ncbi:hypothetical protein [Phenylobacterium sp. NIBR 498073]|uniref:hypothetical protein n=1 Tax=Phenylobacterium sp. NIBR 498073 TaxID=3015177 RepID=UPI0022B3502A|nr:hypothetical protein [Phenylobacterium sp. NIBR 498073]WGU40827.1 hypothetical protein O4N75_03650 [Phenylobacterium sp. NIBR 498073]
MFVTLALLGVALLRENDPVFLFAGMPLVMMIYTDTCLGCGNVLFFCQGKTFWTWMNPLYVPKICPKCAAEI